MTTMSAAVDEPWTPELETQIWQWHKEAKQYSIAHNQNGDKLKRKSYYYGFPIVLLPVIMTFVTQVFPSGVAPTQNSAAFALIGVCSAVYSKLDLGQAYQEHFSFANRFQDICSIIQNRMVRLEAYRGSAAAFAMEIEVKLQGQKHDAPNIDPDCCGCFRTSGSHEHQSQQHQQQHDTSSLRKQKRRRQAQQSANREEDPELVFPPSTSIFVIPHNNNTTIDDDDFRADVIYFETDYDDDDEDDEEEEEESEESNGQRKQREPKSSSMKSMKSVCLEDFEDCESLPPSPTSN